MERTYGRDKAKQDKACCIESIWDRFSHTLYQCTRKRGRGPTGEYCAIHCPEAVAKRHAKKEQRYAENKRAWRKEEASDKITSVAIDFVHGDATQGELIKAVKKYEDL